MPRRRLALTAEERAALQAAQARSPKVRHWRRYQAVLLRAAGVPVAEVARDLGCTEASVSNWTAAWRDEGVAGVAEGAHPGAARRLDPDAEAALDALLTEGDPQAYGYAATGWTAPLLRTELERRGWRVAERTIRRALHRLGWRWKRPKYVLGRPDPAYAEKKTATVKVASRSLRKPVPAGFQGAEIAGRPQMETVHLGLALLGGVEGRAAGLVRSGRDGR
jgi:transposase